MKIASSATASWGRRGILAVQCPPGSTARASELHSDSRCSKSDT